MTIGVIETTFTSAVPGEGIAVEDSANISLDFTTGSGVGTVILQRSFDEGVTWKPTAIATYATDDEERVSTPEPVLYRLNCTVFTSGIIVGRLSY